jgi:hypothetical protein
MLPWAHGHQRKAIRDFVEAIIDQQTGWQAQLARSFGHQEAATKRLSWLLHNERLEPRHLAEAVLLQALAQLPAHGLVRLAINWTKEAMDRVKAQLKRLSHLKKCFVDILYPDCLLPATWDTSLWLAH